MMTIPIFWVVLLIVIIHTILQHLLNWASRRCTEEGEVFLACIGWVLEAILLIVVLAKCLPI